MADSPSPHILVFAGALRGDETLLNALRERGDVRIVDDAESALSALKSTVYDIVVTTGTDLFPLARSEARQRAELIIEHVGQGMCIVDRRANLIWGNTAFQTLPDAVTEAIRRDCAALANELIVSRPGSRTLRSRKRTVRVDSDNIYEVTAAPLRASAGEVAEVVGLVQNVTARHRLQEKVNAIDAAGRELVRLDADAVADLDVGERLEWLQEKIDRFAHGLLHFDHYIVRVLDAKTNGLDAILFSGLSREAADIPIYRALEGNGISGYVAATERSYICPDTSLDPRYLPGLEQAGSSLTVPLMMHDQVVGVLDVESHETAAFTEDDRQFAEIFGRYIAIALNILKLLAVERSTSTGQLAEDVAAELSAPLNDITSSITRLLSQRTDDPALRRELQAAIENVERAKRTLRSITESPGIRGIAPESPQRDPIVYNRHILVAEDDEIIRETIADVLSKSGARIVMARDGQEAVTLLRAESFDLVISDIKMPYKSGYEVFAAARDSGQSCPVILVTGFGYDPDHNIVRASREGLSAVLFKPFKVDQLVDAVHKALTPNK